MRTILTIDDDVLVATKAIAQRERRSVGEVVSNLARRALDRQASAALRSGIPLLPPDRQAIVTLGIVNALRDAQQ